MDQKSRMALDTLRKRILDEKYDIESIDAALETYLSRYNDTSRPGTLAIACEAVGGDANGIQPLQIALSFIDITMDIHDDIIDNSKFKKNVKTLYGKLGKDSSLLVGDSLMVMGFNQLHSAIEYFSKEIQLEVMLQTQNFLTEVVRSHIVESKLKTKKWTVTPETYLEVLRGKAADIEGRMKIGALVGGGSKEEIEALAIFGRNLGILISVRAEYIDIFEPDELQNRVNFECLPLQILYPLHSKKHRREIKEILLKESINRNDSLRILELIDESKSLCRLRAYLERLEIDAIEALDCIQDSQTKDYLKIIIASTLEDM